MRHPKLAELVTNLKHIYGEFYQPYGTSDKEEEGTGFRISGIEATFSVVCLENTPEGMYDIQIESYPPGDYLYNVVIDLDGFLYLIEKYRANINDWPGIKTIKA